VPCFLLAYLRQAASAKTGDQETQIAEKKPAFYIPLNELLLAGCLS
jgi:hypothetical protein